MEDGRRDGSDERIGRKALLVARRDGHRRVGCVTAIEQVSGVGDVLDILRSNTKVIELLNEQLKALDED